MESANAKRKAENKRKKASKLRRKLAAEAAGVLTPRQRTVLHRIEEANIKDAVKSGTEKAAVTANLDLQMEKANAKRKAQYERNKASKLRRKLAAEAAGVLTPRQRTVLQRIEEANIKDAAKSGTEKAAVTWIGIGQRDAADVTGVITPASLVVFPIELDRSNGIPESALDETRGVANELSETAYVTLPDSNCAASCDLVQQYDK